MGKNKNKMRNITIQGNPNSETSVQSETKALIKETVQQIDRQALAEASPEYMGELLRRVLNTNSWGCSYTPGTQEALMILPGLVTMANSIPATDDMGELFRKMVDGYILLNTQEICKNTLNHEDLQPESKRFEFIQDSMPASFTNNLDSTKIRYCSMKSSMLTAEEVEAQTKPKATPVNAKPSASNAVTVSGGKSTCGRCKVEVESKSLRKLVLNDNVEAKPEHAEHNGKMVCQSCLNELQAAHAETIKEAVAEANAQIEQLKADVTTLEAALAILGGKEATTEAKLNTKKQQLANFEIALAKLNK